MAIGKKAARKVKKAVKAVARVSPVELDPRKKGFLTAKKKGRGARIIPPGALGVMVGLAGLKPMKTPAIFSQNRLAKETGTRGLPEQQEARRQAKKKPTSPGFASWNIPTVLSRSPVQRPSKRFAVGATKPASPPKRRRRSKSN